MKSGLLSLALLGSARGCWLRSSIDGKRTEVERHNWLVNEVWTQQSLIADEAADSARARRVAGKRALKQACSDNVHFSECSQDKGSAVRLERCLKSRSNLSRSCRRGLQAWKQVLVETAPDARHREGNGPASKKAAKKGFARAARIQESKDRVTRHFEGQPDWTGAVGWSDPIEIDFFPGPNRHPHHPHHHHHHGGPGRRGQSPHHEVGPHLHARGAPPDFFEGGGFLQREERRPTVFSVLADWILGESSSSDSLDSSSDSWDSSSDDFDAYSSGSSGSSSSSSSSLSPSASGYASPSSSSTSGSFVDAGLFPAGHGIPPSTLIPPGDEVVLEKWERPLPFKRKPFGRRDKNLRSRDSGLIDHQAPPQIFEDFEDFEGVEDFPHPQWFGGGGPDVVVWLGGEQPPPELAGGLEETFERLENKMPEHKHFAPATGSAFDFSDDDDDFSDDEIAPGARNPESDFTDDDVPGQAREVLMTEFLKRQPRPNQINDFVAVAAVPPVVDDGVEAEWEMVAEEDFPVFAGGPRVHSKQHHRGDHIRFRNPLPEDFENQRAWLSESFDVDGDGPDLVEGILAFFFFVGAMTLMLLPFFLLGRALKRLVRSSRRGDGDAEAPDGYCALPADATSAAAAAAGDDDDSIVVTGTPVNPPPSAYL